MVLFPVFSVYMHVSSSSRYDLGEQGKRVRLMRVCTLQIIVIQPFNFSL